MLGIDPLFIKTIFRDLVSYESITRSLTVTDAGQKALNSERISESAFAETWYLLQDPVLDNARFSSHPLSSLDDGEDLCPYIQKDLMRIPPFVFQLDLHPLKEMGLEMHVPEEGLVVTAMEPLDEPERCWRRVAIFVQHDTSRLADQDITIHARLLDQNQSLPIVADWLQVQLQQRRLSLKTLCGLEDEAVAREELLGPGESEEKLQVEERLQTIRQRAIEQRRRAKGQQPALEAETARQLRDIEIRPAFLSSLKQAHEQIIIYSPWINEQVVDDEFIALLEELVQKGIRILIGYGIGHREHQEDRPISAHMQERLHAILTDQGTPGVIAEWLGNSHAKEIIIDSRIHFNGSHNWLSYRGDRFPRGETVYQVTIPIEVQKAHDYLAGRFVQRAQTLWKRASVEEWQSALCILCFLEREQEAADWLQRDKRDLLIPFWLRLARQAVAAGHEPRIMPSLQTIIAHNLSNMQPGALKMETLDTLRTLLKSLQLKTQPLVANFFRENEYVLRQSGLQPL